MKQFAKRTVWIVWAVGALATACTPAPLPAAASRAAIVVMHGDGTQQFACVEFSEPQLTGQELLGRTGWAYQIDAANPMGVLVCRIDHEGCDFPAESCMCRCDRPGSCQYWAYFNRDPGGDWVYGAFGASRRQVTDGSLDAWVWLTSASADEAAAPVLETLTFEAVCGGLPDATTPGGS